MDIDISKYAEEFALLVERPVEKVEAEIEKFVEDGFSNLGAIAQWKTANKMQLANTRKEYLVRFMGYEEPRTVNVQGEDTQVADFFFVAEGDDKMVHIRKSAMWNEERINDILDVLTVGSAYRVKASLTDEAFSRMTSFEEIDDDMVVGFDALEPLAVSSLSEYVNTNDMIRGAIGKTIEIGGITVGFEISDVSPSPPVTVWFGGTRSRIPLDIQNDISDFGIGDEVIVYGYISQSDSNVKINAVSIVRV